MFVDLNDKNYIVLYTIIICLGLDIHYISMTYGTVKVSVWPRTMLLKTNI